LEGEAHIVVPKTLNVVKDVEREKMGKNNNKVGFQAVKDCNRNKNSFLSYNEDIKYSLSLWKATFILTMQKIDFLS